MTSDKTHWSNLKIFANNEKIIIIAPLLIDGDFIFHFQSIILANCLVRNVLQILQQFLRLVLEGL